MARRLRILLEGGIYHVTCRGNERGRVFRDDRDRERLLERIAASAEVFQVRVYLYCLMSNHLHLLVETPLANLDRFMGSLLTGYTVYFNRRHDRHGHLFQGRYGAQVVAGDDYLLKLSRYIHLNPVQVSGWRDRPLSERMQALRDYPWSSYRAYAGRVKVPDWLVARPIWEGMKSLGRPATSRSYARFVEAGLARTDEEFVQLMQARPVAIGSDAFLSDIKRRCLTAAGSRVKREDVSLRAVRRWKTTEEVARAVVEVVGDDAERLFSRPKEGATARGFYAWALQRYAGLTLREIAPILQIGTGAGVCMSIKKATRQKAFARWRQKLELIFKG